MKNTDALLKRAALLQAKIRAAKLAHAELDEIKTVLASRKFRKRTVGKARFVLRDNFESKQTTFRTVAVSRWELIIDTM